MADNKSGFFAKNVQKKAFRAKEKLLQNLGKADKTTDELFDDYVTNFSKQQNAANKLQKELKTYMICVKDMSLASKNLHETLEEVYEVEWLGHDQLHVIGQNQDLIWNDYYQKLNNQVMTPLLSYQNQFPDVRTRIAKRGRKLVDYDSARHNLESLLSNTKKRDETKIAKAQEQLNEAKKMYDDLNQELHDELPALYDSRISFYASNFQSLGAAEANFHAETAKLNNQMSELMERLADENTKGTYTTRRQITSPSKILQNSLTYDTTKDEDTDNLSGMSTPGQGLASFYDVAVPRNDKPKSVSPVSSNRESLLKSDSLHEDVEVEVEVTGEAESNLEPAPDIEPGAIENYHGKSEYEPIQVGAQIHEQSIQNGPTAAPRTTTAESLYSQPKKMEETYAIPAGATTTGLPPGVLYKVRATHKYDGEDFDELTFEVGDIIRVIEYDDPEDQDDGWLMGVKENTGQKGVFPANFTRPI